MSVTSQIIHLIKQGRPPSPLILEGEGRRLFVPQLISAIFCEVHSSCGLCSGCKKVSKGFHPDWIRLPADYKMEDIREALGALRKRPFEARYRLLCLEDLQAHHVAIQNALLKTLEEPSPHWILLISVQSRWVLLNTVRSRSLLVPIPLSAVSDRPRQPVDLSDAEERVFEAVTSQNELFLAQELENFYKERDRARKLWLQLLAAASERSYPGHWRRLAPHLDQGLQDLSRNLHQKNLWDRAWIRSLESHPL